MYYGTFPKFLWTSLLESLEPKLLPRTKLGLLMLRRLIFLSAPPEFLFICGKLELDGCYDKYLSYDRCFSRVNFSGLIFSLTGGSKVDALSLRLWSFIVSCLFNLYFSFLVCDFYLGLFRTGSNFFRYTSKSIG